MKKRLGVVSLLALVAMVSSCGSKNDDDVKKEEETPINSTIDTLKANAKNDIESYYTGKLNSYGVVDKLNTIKTGLSFYIYEIDYALDKETINGFVKDAKDYIDEEVLILFNEMISNYKNDAKIELNTYATDKITSNNISDQNVLASILIYGETLINNANNKESIDQALIQAKSDIDEYINEYLSDKDLRIAKDDAITSLNEYKTNILGTLEDDGTVNTALQTGITNINNSTTIEEVNSMLAQAKTSIDNAVSVLQAKKDLADAKTEAISNLEAYVTTKLGVLEDDGTVQNSKDLGIANINSSLTIEAVTTALNNAKSDIDLKVTALEASVNLKVAKNNAISELEDYVVEILGSLVDDGSVESAKQSGISYINAATTIESITSALNTAKGNIDSAVAALQASVDLANAKAAANETISAYTTEKLNVAGIIDSEGLVAAKVAEIQESINTKETINEVNTRLESGKTEIDQLIANLSSMSEADKLAALKESAINTLNSYAQDKLGTLTDDGSVEATIISGTTAINAATDSASVNSALTQAKTNVDSVVSVLQIAKELADAKASAVSQLQSYKTSQLTAAGVTDDGTVAAIVTAGTSSINEATTTEDVTTALATAKTNVDNAIAVLVANKEAQELSTAKTNALSELNTYYTTAISGITDDGTVLTAKNNGVTAINSSTTVMAVNSALSTAKTNIDSAVEALQAANDLETAKTNAISELQVYATTKLGTLIDDGTIATAVTNGTASINNATDTSGVNSALAQAKTNVDNAVEVLQVAKDLSDAKETAINTLNNYYTSAISGITDDGTVLAAKNNGVTAINSSTTVTAVNSALQTAKSNIDNAVVTIKNNNLNTLKQNAKTELSSYASTELTKSGKTDDGTVQEAIVAGNALIENASTESEVSSALVEAKQNVLATINALSSSTQTEPDTNTSVLKVCQGLNEEIALEWSDSKYSSTTTSVYYKLSGDTSWTIIDSELVRDTSSGVRADILGLETGNYSIKLESGSNVVIKNDIDVYAQDRSGYAHFNNSTGIGAYNNDGTLKSNAIVIYVTNENKNTVKATLGGKEYTGLVNILQNASKSSNPIAIRILGKIQTNQWKSKSNAPRLADNSNYTSSEDKEFFTNTFDTTYGDNLAGLTVKLMDKKAEVAYNYKTTATGLTQIANSKSSAKTTTYKGTQYSSAQGTVYDDDSYTNMLDVSGAKNVTVEGIGTDAIFFQFGFTWSNCNSIEVRNITFTDYPEDACSFEGTSGSETSYGNYWIHNNVFNRGKNNWDVSGERDKPCGDGAMDIKFCKGVTASYNRYNSCKKTGLIGGNDTNLTINVTFHHNYYNQVGSRLPLGRQANMHFYNNYYYKCTTGQDIRANAFAFSEANYFEGCTNPQKVTTTTYSGTKIKSYGDYLTGCGSSAATVVSSRTESLSGANCKPDGKTNYSNFDTNSSLFYYDSTNKVSDVTLLQTASDAKSTVVTYAGCLTSSSTALKLNDVPSGGGSTGGDSGNTGSDTNAQVLTFPSSNSYFNVTGNTSTSKGSATYNGETYTTCLKMESSTSITFTTTSSTTLTIVLGESEAGSKIKVDGTAYSDTTTNVLTISLNAGSHEITKGDSCNVFYVSVN